MRLVDLHAPTNRRGPARQATYHCATSIMFNFYTNILESLCSWQKSIWT